MKFIFTIAIIVGGMYYFGAFTPDEWRGFLYPDRNDLSIVRDTGLFESLEQCSAATISYARQLNLPHDQIDWECGLNCKSDPNKYGGLLVCEETAR